MNKVYNQSTGLWEEYTEPVSDLTEQTFVELVESQSYLITAPDSNFIFAVINPITHDLLKVSYTLLKSGVTKSDVGLPYVDNTADLDKPISTAVQNALDDKLDASAYQQHFLGNYTTVLALETAHPTASAGDYALVDAGNGQDAILYIWDNSDAAWIPSASAVLNTTDSLTEGNTNLYFTDIRAIKAVPYDWECTSEGTTPFLVTSVQLSAGDYDAPSAYIGCANISHSATVDLRKESDNSLVKSIGGVAGGLAWRTAGSGFTLATNTTINVYLKTDSTSGIGFLDGFKFN